MSTVRTYSRSLITSWVAQGIDLVAAFFLAPFMIRSLGDERYGVWTVVLSTAGWLALADVGLRRSVSKHLNEYLGQHDEMRALQLVSTTAVMFAVTGLVVLLISIAVGAGFEWFFPSLPKAYLSEAWKALAIAGFTFGIGLQSSLQRRILESFNRFDLANYAMMGMTAVRVSGVILVLLLAGGLVELAIVALAGATVATLAMYVLAHRAWPALKMRMALVRKSEVHNVLRTGTYVFFDSIAYRLAQYSSIIVIGVLLDMKLVTVFAIGLVLVQYSQSFLEHVARVMTPDIFKHAGAKDMAALRHLFVRASNVTAFLSVPVYVGFLFFGSEFIHLWMDRDPGDSGRVLTILTAGALAALSSQAVGSILIGLGRARLAAVLSMIEGISNVVLAVLFVYAFHWGLAGVALGAVIPMVGVTGIIKPLVVCRIIHLGLAEYAQLVLLRWLRTAACFGGICLLISVTVPAGCWFFFVLKTATLGLFFLPIGWYVLLAAEVRASISQRLFCREIHASREYHG